jgi:hypothetical protein
MSSIYNTVSVANFNLSTGDNQVLGVGGDTSISTGDIFFDFLIKNGPININNVNLNCCNNDGPYDPDKPSNPPDSDDSSRNDGGDNLTSGDANSNSAESSSTAGAGNGVEAILGLSDTSSQEARSLIFFAGMIMMTFGFSIVGKEALQK